MNVPRGDKMTLIGSLSLGDYGKRRQGPERISFFYKNKHVDMHIYTQHTYTTHTKMSRIADGCGGDKNNTAL